MFFKSDGSVILVWFLLISFCFPQLMKAHVPIEDSVLLVSVEQLLVLIEYDMGTGIRTLTLTQAEAHSMEVLGWTCPRLSGGSRRFFGGSFKQNDGYKMLSQVIFQHTIHRHKSLFQLCVWRSSYLWNTISFGYVRLCKTGTSGNTIFGSIEGTNIHNGSTRNSCDKKGIPSQPRIDRGHEHQTSNPTERLRRTLRWDLQQFLYQRWLIKIPSGYLT